MRFSSSRIATSRTLLPAKTETPSFVMISPAVIPHEVEQLGGKQVDDLGLDIIAAAVELGEQALRMSLDVAFVFVEQRLEIES
jgi:hypothetical protein